MTGPFQKQIDGYHRAVLAEVRKHQPGPIPVTKIARKLGVSRATVYRALRRESELS